MASNKKANKNNPDKVTRIVRVCVAIVLVVLSGFLITEIIKNKKQDRIVGTSDGTIEQDKWKKSSISIDEVSSKVSEFIAQINDDYSESISWYYSSEYDGYKNMVSKSETKRVDEPSQVIAYSQQSDITYTNGVETNSDKSESLQYYDYSEVNSPIVYTSNSISESDEWSKTPTTMDIIDGLRQSIVNEDLMKSIEFNSVEENQHKNKLRLTGRVKTTENWTKYLMLYNDKEEYLVVHIVYDTDNQQIEQIDLDMEEDYKKYLEEHSSKEAKINSASVVITVHDIGQVTVSISRDIELNAK